MGLPISIAIDGFILNAGARRLSKNTLVIYSLILRKFKRYLADDPLMANVTKRQVEEFLVSLDTLSKKSVLGHHAALSSFWKWGVAEQLAERNIVREIPQPVPEERVIQPFTQTELKAMLDAVDKSLPYSRPGQRECQHSNPTALRNRAILYLLLDTGVRVAELCGLRLCDLDLKARHVVVYGKGSKERLIPFSDKTGQILWRYIATRSKEENMNAALFSSTRTGERLATRDVFHTLRRIGERAGVQGVHPHRFRHTFAIQFLRNHGDIYTLQRILGHSTLDMVKRYLAIAQTDVEAAHRQASPVANWRL